MPAPRSLWDDWTPGDEGEIPVATALPGLEAPAAPAAPPRERVRRTPPDEPRPDGAFDLGLALVWVLAVSGTALLITIGLGFLLAVVSSDDWLLGLVGNDVGLGTETARQAIEIPFGALRLEGASGPFVYGLVLPAALVAAGTAYAARTVEGVPRRWARTWAAAAALPYAMVMSVVALIAVGGNGVLAVSGGRLLLWSALLVGLPAALGVRPVRPRRWFAWGRALAVPFLGAWAVLTVAFTLWALALTMTQQNQRIGYDIKQSDRQVAQTEDVADLDLSPVPALAVLALTPANIGLSAMMDGVLAEQRFVAPLGATDRRVDDLGSGARRRFVLCTLGDLDGSCADVRVLDGPDLLPPAFGWFLVLVVVGTTLGAAAIAGGRLGDLAPDGARLACGALVGPVWAIALVVADAAVDDSHGGWSVFTGALLLGTAAGMAGAAFRAPQPAA